MKIIHCNIHGDIQVSDTAIAIIDTWEFQRLRQINQTGLAKFVFPGAVTTRFEHSLGTYYLTGKVLSHLGMDPSDPVYELIKLGGLCHDLGHGPFSHMSDTWCLSHYEGAWKRHENRSQSIFRHIAKQKTLLTEKDVKFVCEIIYPSEQSSEKWFMNVVNNTVNGIDTDKLDYIVRDNRAFGLHLNIDVNRIILNMQVLEGKICFCERIADELLNLFFVRHRRYTRIYTHPTIARIERVMFDVLTDFIYAKIVAQEDIEEFCNLTDFLIESTGNRSKLRSLFEKRGKCKNASTTPPAPFSPGIIFKKVFVYNRKTKKVSLFNSDCEGIFKSRDI